MGSRLRRQAWGMISPTLAILVFAGFVPFLYVLYLSFFNYNVFSRMGMVFSGLNNYRNLVFDPAFLHALGVSFLFIAFTCSIELALGYGIAQLCNRKFIGRGLFRVVFTLPLTIAPITIGSIWVLLTRPGVGPLPYWLSKLGIAYDPGRYGTQAFATVVAMDVWHWTPFVALALLAGLVSLPKEPFDAARVDGASALQIQKYITIPLLRPVILPIIFIRIMDGFKIFDEVWMLTGGGPAQATRFVSIHIVRSVLAQTNYGYGSAMSILVLYLTIIMSWLLLTIISQKLTKERA